MGKALEHLSNMQYGVGRYDFIDNHYRKLLKSGLQVTTICSQGEGRSRTVARTLSSEYRIQSVYLIGGIFRLANLRFEKHTDIIVELLNQCPTIAVILGASESLYYLDFLKKFKNLAYFHDPLSAIESLAEKHSA